MKISYLSLFTTSIKRNIKSVFQFRCVNVAFIVILLMFTISSSAVAFVVNEISYTLLSSTKKTVEVVSGSMKYFGNVNIPSTIVYNNVTYTVVSV